MAVSIMSACCRVSVLLLVLLGVFLQVLIQGEVFRAPRAQDVFLRSKRANTFLVEEILQGNLERECYEELCSYEEAREYFEDTPKTIAFWTVYYDGDQCQPNPCLHGGNCTDKVGGFHCSCTAPYYGTVCELEALVGLVEGEGPPSMPQLTTPEYTKCPTEGPTACHQLCTVSYHTFTCSCLSGFKLQEDGRTCLPEVEFPCGKLSDKFNTTASVCRHGKCPWQVSLLNSRGAELCAGVVMGPYAVLTAARCLFLASGSALRPSDIFIVADNKKMPVPVRALSVHNRFSADHHDNDLVLLQLAQPLPFSPTLLHLCLPSKDFSENILMHSGRTGITERRGVSHTQELNYMTLDECRSQLNVAHPLSNKMFCMKSQNGAQGLLNRPLGNQTSTQGIPNQTLGNHHGGQKRLDGQTMNQYQNQTRESQNGATGTTNGAENTNSSNIQNNKLSAAERSEVSDMHCGGLLPGTPVATVDRGTAFLTGLLISSTAGCDGLVFTKLSRYLGWIKPRLESARVDMISQVRQYPEIH